ncbi:MAG: UDP-N-acetylmuramate--L-alanine ligase [Clostridia bacterium]|nr:UDP-N-acetylmuramate--L-alanine ligase [Clostridia bacterium]
MFFKELQDLSKINYVHFIGIGGISMSAIAKVMLHRGIKVSGSDFSGGASCEELKKLGADVVIGHSADNIKNPDLVVYTAAISKDNPELMRARELGIETIARAEMLGRIMKDYKKAISIAGTHGKTTTTSMMSYVLMKAFLDPTIMVGGELDIINGNFRIGNSEYFLTESCEYCRSFLQFFPTVAIILNVEEDHLDYYKDLDDIKSAFRDFVDLLPSDGILVTCAEDSDALDCVKNAKCAPITYGFDKGDYRAKNITFDDFGYPTFDVYKDDEKLTTLTLNVVGRHNVLNATSVLAASLAMGIDLKYIKEGLESYHGTKRRFEKKGYCNGALIVDDYAHHPTEILAAFDSVKKIKHNTVWCIFQPHTYTRTKALFDDFVKVLSRVDRVILTDIYAAREKDTGLVSSKDLAEKIPDSKYIADFNDIAEYIKKVACKGDIIITMGAGNVVNIGDLIKD